MGGGANPGGTAPAGADPTPAGPPAAFAHTPVLCGQVVRYLDPRPGSTVVDATVGGGGHAAAVLARLAPGGCLVGIDRDPAAVRAAEARLRPLADAAGVALHLLRGNYAHLQGLLARLDIPAADGVLFDLGVSSPQLDDPARGFSYRADAELDMRMDPDQALTAYHLVNGLSQEELAGIIRRYGEERWAARIAAFIVRRRREVGMIATTGQLVEVILDAVPAAARRRGPHPARRTFQALRIAVNQELEALEAGLRAAVRCLRPGGRVVAISYHSLEDRVVKHVFRELAHGCTCPPEWPACRCGRQPELRTLVAHPLRPAEEELAANPRARSAKLRAALRLGVRAAPAAPGLAERAPTAATEAPGWTARPDPPPSAAPGSAAPAPSEPGRGVAPRGRRCGGLAGEVRGGPRQARGGAPRRPARTPPAPLPLPAGSGQAGPPPVHGGGGEDRRRRAAPPVGGSRGAASGDRPGGGARPAPVAGGMAAGTGA